MTQRNQHVLTAAEMRREPTPLCAMKLCSPQRTLDASWMLSQGQWIYEDMMITS